MIRYSVEFKLSFNRVLTIEDMNKLASGIVEAVNQAKGQFYTEKEDDVLLIKIRLVDAVSLHTKGMRPQ